MSTEYKVIVKTGSHRRSRRRCSDVKETEKFNWICLAQDKGRWWAVGGKEMNLAPIKTYVFLEQVSDR